MNTETVPRFNAIRTMAGRVRATPSTRLLQSILGCMITLGGMLLLMADCGEAATPLMHRFLEAIRSAMT